MYCSNFVANDLALITAVIGHKMPHKLWYVHDSQVATLIDFIFVNQRPAGSILDTGVSAAINADS